MSDSIKAKARSGVLWGVVAQLVVVGLQLLQSVVAARLLGPGAYAEIAVIFVVAAVAVPFAQSGLGVSIIYFQECDPKRIAQIQTLSILVATLSAAAVYAAAEPVAAYFRLEGAALLVKIAAAQVWFSAITTVWQSLLKRNLIFRDAEIAYVISYVIGFITIMAGLALSFGAVSVIVGQTVAAAFNALFVRIALQRQGVACGLALPGPGVWPHLSYGFVNTLSGAASVVVDRIDAIVIGGRLSAAAFGAYGLFSRVITAISTPVQRIKTSVEFPTYAHVADDPERLLRALTKALALTSLATFPVFLGFAAVADIAAPLALGPDWTAFAPVLAVMSVYGLLRIISSSSTPVFMASGHVRRALVLVLVRLVIMPILILGALAVSETLLAVALTVTAAQATLVVVNYAMFIRPVVGPCAGRLAVVLLRAGIASGVMLGAVYGTRRLLADAPPLETLAASIAAGGLAYIAASAATNRSVIREMLYMLRPLTDAIRGARTKIAE